MHPRVSRNKGLFKGFVFWMPAYGPDAFGHRVAAARVHLNGSHGRSTARTSFCMRAIRHDMYRAQHSSSTALDMYVRMYVLNCGLFSRLFPLLVYTYAACKATRVFFFFLQVNLMRPDAMANALARALLMRVRGNEE